MQCFRGNNNRSPPLTPLRSRSLSIDSLNKYFANTINRKSFVRRSFEIVRKNVLRQSQYLLRQNGIKVRKAFKRSELRQNDPNNNRSSYDDSQLTNRQFSNTYCDDGSGGGEGVFVISTDDNILTPNTNGLEQFGSNVRWVFKWKKEVEVTITGARTNAKKRSMCKSSFSTRNALLSQNFVE